MEINPSEVTKILKEQIKNFGDKAGTTTSVISSFERKDFSGLTISTLNSSLIMPLPLFPFF